MGKWALLGFFVIQAARAEAPWLDPNRAIQLAQPAGAAVCDPRNPAAMDTWSKAGFGHPRAETLDLGSEYAGGGPWTHQFHLSVVVFRGAKWTLPEVRARIRKVARIYAQCGIQVAPATLVETDAWHEHLDMHGGDNPDAGVEKSIAAALPPGMDRPVLFFVRSFDDGTMAAAAPAYYAPPGHPLLNTVFIADPVIAADATEDKSYSTEAHEVAHVLGNFSQHLKSPVSNLMSDPRAARPNGVLTSSQCAQLKKGPGVRPL
jgi:hypothetical protein